MPALAAQIASADASMSIEFHGSSGPFAPGETVTLRVMMHDVSALTPAAGFQAFLAFDPAKLQFNSGAYTTTPFPLPLISPITARGGEIEIAAGINFFLGDPSHEDAMLATLVFTALAECSPGDVYFRAHQPPSNLSTLLGTPILPLHLHDLAGSGDCIADANGDDVVNVSDLLIVIAGWGSCPLSEPCCPGDVDGTGTVNVSDLLLVISGWGNCS